MRKRKKFGLVALLFYVNMCAPFLPVAASPLEQELYQAARKEGELSWWETWSPRDAQELWQSFSKKYPGIKLNYFEVQGPQMAVDRILAMKKIGRMEVDVVSPGSTYFEFASKDFLTTLGDLALDTNFSNKAMTSDGMGVAIEWTIHVIAYNTDRLRSGDAPKKWEDLGSPKFKGKKIGVQFEMKDLVELVPEYGEEKMVELVRKIRANEPVIVKGRTQLTTLVAAGELWLGLSALHQVLKEKGKGAPIDFARSSVVGAISPVYTILRNGPHPNASKLFIRWLMTSDGQAAIDQYRRKGSPFPGSQTEAARLLKGLKISVMPLEWMVDGTMERLSRRFMKELGVRDN